MSIIKHPAKGERAGAFSGEAMREVCRRMGICQAGNLPFDEAIWESHCGRRDDSLEVRLVLTEFQNLQNGSSLREKIRGFSHLGLAKSL
jgi:hypothetical protein